MKKQLMILFMILLLSITPIVANDWNTFQENIQHTGYLDDKSDFITNIWTANLGSPIESSPAIFDNNIFIITIDGVLKSIDMENGEVDWELDFESNTNSSISIYNNTLYVGCDDGLKAVNIENEDIKWEFDTSASIESTPFITNDTIYAGCDDGHLYGFDMEGNKTLDVDLGGELKSSPVVANESIFIGSTNTKLYCLDLDGSEKWTFTTGDEILSTAAISNDYVIFGSNDGTLYCLNITDGAVNWRVDLGDKVRSSATIDEYNNNVYIGSDEGNLTCVDLRDGIIKWSYSTGAPIESTCALKDNALAFGSDNGNCYVLNKYTGQEIFTYNPGTLLFNNQFSSSPVIYGNNVFFAGEDGYLYSLDIDKHETPLSEFLYYTLAILIIAIVILVAVVKKSRKR